MANLITTSEYKAYVGISSTNQDAEINAIVPKVSSLVKTYCGRTFIDYVSDAKTEYSSGGHTYIYLKEAPILSVSSVEYSADYGATWTTLTEFTDYTVDLENDRIYAIPIVYADGFPKLVNAYKITYTAGYESTPEDLKLACLDLVSYYLKSDMSIKSTRNAGANQTSVEFITSSSMPSHIRRVLDLYKLEYF